jgi:glutamate-1-semialdehyde 2,1-aminomutase
MSDRLNVSNSLEIWSRAEELIAGGSQTNSKRPSGYAPGAYPIYADRSQGCRVWDVDGNEYLDYVLGLGPITLGYCYPAVDEAIREQLGKGIVWGLMTPLEVECAELMREMVPCCEMVRYLKGGAEVTTAAARIARAHTGRELILNSGYRGWADVWSAAIEPPMGRGIPECLRGLVKSFPRDDLNVLEDLLKTCSWTRPAAARPRARWCRAAASYATSTACCWSMTRSSRAFAWPPAARRNTMA